MIYWDFIIYIQGIKQTKLQGVDSTQKACESIDKTLNFYMNCVVDFENFTNDRLQA